MYKSIMCMLIFFFSTVFVMPSLTLACHKGGAQGVASADPLHLLIDISTSGPFISFSTTSGTAGCENWDLVKTNRVEYMDVTWNNLSEDVSKGKGEHFSALSKLYGCEGEYIQTFESMLYGNYTHLFEEISDIEKYERAHLLDYEINRLMKNYRIKEFCKFSS